VRSTIRIAVLAVALLCAAPASRAAAAAVTPPSTAVAPHARPAPTARRHHARAELRAAPAASRPGAAAPARHRRPHVLQPRSARTHRHGGGAAGALHGTGVTLARPAVARVPAPRQAGGSVVTRVGPRAGRSPPRGSPTRVARAPRPARLPSHSRAPADLVRAPHPIDRSPAPPARIRRAVGKRRAPALPADRPAFARARRRGMLTPGARPAAGGRAPVRRNTPSARTRRSTP